MSFQWIMSCTTIINHAFIVFRQLFECKPFSTRFSHVTGIHFLYENDLYVIFVALKLESRTMYLLWLSRWSSSSSQYCAGRRLTLHIRTISMWYFKQSLCYVQGWCSHATCVTYESTTFKMHDLWTWYWPSQRMTFYGITFLVADKICCIFNTVLSLFCCVEKLVSDLAIVFCLDKLHKFWATKLNTGPIHLWSNNTTVAHIKGR